MTPEQAGRLRVGDEERELAAAALGEAFALGRLDDQEYAERLDAAWTSRTRADLDVLFHDLPAAETRPVPVPVSRGGLPTPVVLLLVGLGVVLLFSRPFLALLLLVVAVAVVKKNRRTARRDAGDPYWR